MKKMMIIGAAGQIGSELLLALQERYGSDRVVPCYHLRRPIRRGEPAAERRASSCVDDCHCLSPLPQPAEEPLEFLDCRDGQAVSAVVRRHGVGTIFHLAALLSARGEAEPQAAWQVNVQGLLPVLEVARQEGCSVFFPSSIGAFGPDTPKRGTPQCTIQRPVTLYGITKVTGELLCEYYHRRWGVDTRGLRFPGLISLKAPPGGGTTDYAVEIFRAAHAVGHYTSYLQAGTTLDLMYMPDAIDAAIGLMEADPDRLRFRNAYNVSAMSVDPEALAASIRAHLPGFRLEYSVDPLRQAIADSWPDALDDAAAREDWNWRPRYDLPAMTAAIFRELEAEVVGSEWVL